MAKRDEIEPATTKHPREWAKDLGTPKHVYAGAETLGAHRWIEGVLVTRDEYEATVFEFLNIQIGG